jgi:hypothetical protein
MSEERVKEGMSTATIVMIMLGVAACGGIGLIGVLVAIAVPNFLSFNCKARTSEAKVNLAGLYTAETAFHEEYGSYSTDLISVNWQPDGAPIYLYGFASAGPLPVTAELKAQLPAVDPSRRATDNVHVIRGSGTGPAYDTSRMHTNGSGFPLTAAALPPATFAGKDEFLAGAVGDDDSDPTLDIWTIDQNKNLIHVVDDCSS